MKAIHVISKQHHDVIFKTYHTEVEAPEDSVILIDLSIDFIEDIYQLDEKMVIEYKNEKITIHDFFSNDHQHDLVLKDTDHRLFKAEVLDSINPMQHEFKFVKISSYLPLLYIDDVDANLAAKESLILDQALQQKMVQHSSKALAAIGTGYTTKSLNLLDTDKQGSLYEVLNQAQTIDYSAAIPVVQDNMFDLKTFSFDELLNQSTVAMTHNVLNHMAQPQITAIEVQQDGFAELFNSSHMNIY